MLIDWVSEGFGAGARIWFAAFAVLALTGAILAILALGMMLFGGSDEDDSN